MNYDELVKELREHAERFDYDGWTDTAIWFEKAADAIERLSNAGSAYGRGWTLGYDAGGEESKPRWIPVTERLPEKSGKFLCNVKQFNQYAGKQYYYVDILVFHEDCFFEDGIGTQRVTHWQPLPEPPKEETE